MFQVSRSFVKDKFLIEPVVNPLINSVVLDLKHLGRLGLAERPIGRPTPQEAVEGMGSLDEARRVLGGNVGEH